VLTPEEPFELAISHNSLFLNAISNKLFFMKAAFSYE
jgi:hypothetical protein